VKLKARFQVGTNGNGNGNGQNGNGSHPVPKQKVRLSSRKATLEDYARELSSVIGPVKCVADTWHRYLKGMWQEVHPDIFLPPAWKLQNEPRKVEASKKMLEAIRQQSQVAEESLYGAIRYQEGTHYLINCANCVVRVSLEDGSCERLEHSPDFMFTLQVSSNYLPEARCPEFWKVLKEVLPAKDNRLLNLDFATSCLTPDAKFQCMLFCTGSGGNGKSTVWEAIAGCLGKDVVSRVSYHDLCANNRKYVWKLERMLLNLGTETVAKPIGENAVVKAITCGEAFDTDRMYREGFRMKTTCKLCQLTNHQTTYEAGSNAEVRRTRISHYGQTFEGGSINRSLESVLNGERDGIFNMLLRRLGRVLTLSEIGYGDEVSQAAYKKFKGNNNLVLEFINKCLVLGQENSYVSKDHLWLSFQNFASKFQRSPWKRQTFFRKLYEIRPELSDFDDDYKARLRIGGKRTYVVWGIKFNHVGEALLSE
jgi:P4 family phage/plasmid primase-like protien